jgi:hypothetical protein
VGEGRLERLAPLAGVAFAVVFAVGLLTGGDTPATDAPGEEVIAHYADSGKVFAAILAMLIAALLFLFFAGALRGAMGASTGAPDWLGTVAFGGAVIYAVALAIFAMSQIMLLDAADLGRPEVAQALNIFDNDNFFPAVLGLAAVLLATGLHALGSAVLPKWLAWVSIALAVLSMAGPAGILAFLLFPLWVLAVAIVLYRGAGAPRIANA